LALLVFLPVTLLLIVPSGNLIVCFPHNKNYFLSLPLEGPLSLPIIIRNTFVGTLLAKVGGCFAPLNLTGMVPLG